MTRFQGYEFQIDDELSEGDLVAFLVITPSKQKVHIWAEVELDGRTAILRQFAIYGVYVKTLNLGLSGLRSMAQAAMEKFDVDCIRIEEARRTTGANPNRTLKEIRFNRKTI